MIIHLGFGVWVKMFDGLQCTAGQHEGLTIEQCPEPAVCVAVDRYGYYLGCYCLEHQPVMQPEPSVFPCSICGREFEGHKELDCVEVARRKLGEALTRPLRPGDSGEDGTLVDCTPITPA